MSKEIEKLAKQHGAEREYYAAEAIAEVIVATINGISALASRVRTALRRQPAHISLPRKRDLASG